MPRIARGLCDGFIYHVLNRGNGRQQVFHTDGDYRGFIGLMEEARTSHGVNILAYCLMPNHFHLLLQPEAADAMSKWMQWLMTSHVRRYHHCHGTCGHVWQGRFKSFIVQEDEHLLAVVRYIEGNPVRAGLAESAADWAWSSHRERISGTREKMLTALPVPLPERWTEYVDTALTAKEIEQMRRSVNRQSPYGREGWIQKLCTELGLEATIRERGRPRKEGKK
jgi:putative transposase